MKAIKNIGLVIFLIGLATFTVIPVIGTYQLDQNTFEEIIKEKNIKSDAFIQTINQNVVGKKFNGMLSLSPAIITALENANAQHKKNKEYKKVIYTNGHDMAALVGKKSGTGFIAQNKGLMWFFTFGLGIIGALMFILPNVILLGKKGIKNDAFINYFILDRE